MQNLRRCTPDSADVAEDESVQIAVFQFVLNYTPIPKLSDSCYSSTVVKEWPNICFMHMNHQQMRSLANYTMIR